MKILRNGFMRRLVAVLWAIAAVFALQPTAAAQSMDTAPTPLPITWHAGGGPLPFADSAEAVSGASRPKPFLGFPDKASFHRAAGWTSAGLLAAAGVVGALRAWDLMSAGHEYRDLNHIDEDSIGTDCAVEISSLWGNSAGQALRWAHIGLLAAGESLYLANAVTGIGFIKPGEEGTTGAKLHRLAFFTHAGLMVAEAVMGYFTSMALSEGNHELVRTLGLAHAAVGFAIPIVIIGSGAIVDL